MRDILKVRANRKKYYSVHKEKINEKQKEKINCEICDVKINRCNISHHRKSKLHIKNLEEKN